MSKVLQERGFGSLPSSTETNPRDQVKSISTAKADFSEIRHIRHEANVAQDVKILDTYDHSLPQKEKDPGSFTLPCFIHNICFDKALVDLGASVSVMPFFTYTNLSLGILSHTRLTIELADRTIKQPKGIAENVLVRFIFPIDFIILDIPEDNDVLLILGRRFLSTAHSKIDVFKRKITLRVGEEKLVFKSVKPATSIIKRVFVIKSLDSKTNFIREGDESFDPIYGCYIELNDLDTPLETKTDRDDFVPIFVKTGSYKMEFSCVIGYKYVITDLLPSLPINLMSKFFYYSIFGDKDEGKSHAGTLIDIPIFIGSFSIISGFTIIDDDDMTKDVHISGAIGRRSGARGRRDGGRGGRRGCGRGSTSGLKLMDEDDIRQSMEDEHMKGLLDEQDDLRQKQEKEHQDKLDKEALQQAKGEEFIFPDQEDSMDVEMYNRTKASINFMVNTQESVTHGQPSSVEAESIKDRLKAVRDGQKSYADKRRKPLEFSVVDDKLNFMEEHVEILEREVKKLKQSRIAIVKVWWNSKCRPEFTWEREDQMKLKYPHLFIDVNS
ncbi:ribonuclease H-like domain-containing protein [Tanacetum coccineum]